MKSDSRCRTGQGSQYWPGQLLTELTFSARYQTQFSSPQLISRSSQQRQQQQQQQQELQGLPLPGSGKGLFDQIVKRINSGHRENARRKQNKVGQESLVIRITGQMLINMI